MEQDLKQNIKHQNTDKTIQVQINPSKGALIAMVLLLVAGVALAALGIVRTVESKEFAKKCERTRGTVVDYSVTTSDGDYIYYAIYEYRVDGETYTVQDQNYSEFKPEQGEKSSVYYDPENPEYAKIELKSVQDAQLIGVGVVLAVIGIVLLLARFGANESIVQIGVGLIFVMMGLGIPILVGSFLLLLFTGIFALCGVVVIVKAITKLTGNEGGAIDQAIDEKFQMAEDALVDAFGTGEDGTDVLTNLHTSALVYVPKIVKGISAILGGLLFVGAGAFAAFGAGQMIGIVFLLAGIAVIVSGIVTIKRGLEIRKENGNTLY